MSVSRRRRLPRFTPFLGVDEEGTALAKKGRKSSR